MLLPNYFYWFRIDNKYMTEPWLDQALMDSAYRSVFFIKTKKLNTRHKLYFSHHFIFEIGLKDRKENKLEFEFLFAFLMC